MCPHCARARLFWENQAEAVAAIDQDNPACARSAIDCILFDIVED
jgi:hypothetical protein